MASQYDLVETELSFNGRFRLDEIEKEMVKTFADFKLTYNNSKTPKSIQIINRSLKKANNLIYRECLKRAPVIKPNIAASETNYLKPISLRDKKQMITRKAMSNKFKQAGIVSRYVVTFKAAKGDNKHSAAEYAAAIEFGRDAFIQVMEKTPTGSVQGGDSNFWLRGVGAMQAQPFMLPAQKAKAQTAINYFAADLTKNWLKALELKEKKKRRNSR